MIIKEGIISSRQNDLIVKTALLKDKKHRNIQKLFLINGIKLFCEAVISDTPIDKIFLRQSDSLSLLKLVKKSFFDKKMYKNVNVFVLADTVFDKISDEKSPQGIICSVKHLDFFHKYTTIDKDYIQNLPKNETIMLLCSLRDPGNLGTIIRSAHAFGIKRLFISADCADIYNSRTIRAAMGALFQQKIDIVDNFAESVIQLSRSGRRVLAAELSSDATILSKINICPSDCVVIGNEANGIPRGISQLCDSSVYIPINEKSESLNAAIAASIFMWEQTKQSK